MGHDLRGSFFACVNCRHYLEAGFGRKRPKGPKENTESTESELGDRGAWVAEGGDTGSLSFRRAKLPAE